MDIVRKFDLRMNDGDVKTLGHCYGIDAVQEINKILLNELNVMEKNRLELETSLVDTTTTQYNTAYGLCSNVFLNKLKDYGCSWRVLRLPSLTDQILIKVLRIRSIQEKGVSRIEDGIVDELIGIANYSVMALIQYKLGYVNEIKSINSSDIILEYAKTFNETYELMLKKNHDYGEAWRSMRISSMVDLIFTKLLRIKEIEDNQGKTIASEGVDGNYADIVNYAIFSLIQLNTYNNGK
jgi:hypothetical protein